jgi:hypothetical protein
MDKMDLKQDVSISVIKASERCANCGQTRKLCSCEKEKEREKK